MLRRGRPLAAALVLGVIWWAWHLPTFFISTLSQHQLSIPVFLVNSMALSVIMTWLFQRSRGDLLLMILVHLAANYCGAIGCHSPSKSARKWPVLPSSWPPGASDKGGELRTHRPACRLSSADCDFSSRDHSFIPY
jgi:membrane protease YdiL (CAAX protease family)